MAKRVEENLKELQEITVHYSEDIMAIVQVVVEACFDAF